MKYILSIFLLSSTCLIQAQSPITLTRLDFPCPTATNCGLPDSVLYTNVPLSGNTADVSLTGVNTIWNTIPLKNGTLQYQNYLPMSATPFIFQLAFLSCDFVQPLVGNNIIGNLPVTDAYEYYNYAGTASSRLEIKGFGAYVTIPGQTTAIPLPAIYSSPDIVYQFPIAFGNIDSSNSGYSITLPLGGVIGDITFKRNQTRINEVDGWGNITTPAGSFDVLRLKSSITRIDSVITGFFPIGFPSKPIEFKWLGQTKKLPIFQVNGNMTGSAFNTNSITYWGQEPLNTSHIQAFSNLTIYPNPTQTESQIRYTLLERGDVSVYISDANGKTVGQFHFKDQASGQHEENLPMNLLSSGTYQIRCISNNQVIGTQLIKF